MQSTFSRLIAVGFFCMLFLASENCVAQTTNVGVIELRNYLLRPDTRDKYINAFETLADTLNGYGNYILGQFHVRDQNDRFAWIRGFDDMPARKKALEGFFGSKFWETASAEPGKYLVNYTNVFLMKPLRISNTGIDTSSAFDAKWFKTDKEITVINFYQANGMRDQFIEFLQKNYDSILRVSGRKDISYWITVAEHNNYPTLPVFQDKNLVVAISFFKDEQEYNRVVKKINTSMSDEQMFQFNRLVTTKNTWILSSITK